MRMQIALARKCAHAYGRDETLAEQRVEQRRLARANRADEHNLCTAVKRWCAAGERQAKGGRTNFQKRCATKAFYIVYRASQWSC